MSFDKSIGRIISALDNKQMLNNSIILVLSDNGAPTEDIRYANAGSNWPLRGVKFSSTLRFYRVSEIQSV